jgi:dihydropteroate synthase
VAHSHLYIRPLGLLYGAAADAARADGLALPLAGGQVAFTLAELVEGKAGNVKRRLMPTHELTALKDADLKARLERTISARPPLFGLDWQRPRLMGVVNVTPDSFSDGGLYDTTEEAIAQAASLAAAGADIVDVGGESTRPGADTVEEEAELDRVVPVIEGIAGMDALISVDTRKASVARAAHEKGAKILNDVSALTFDAGCLKAAAETGLGVVLMHAKGDPKTMQQGPQYEDVALEVFDFLEHRIGACLAAGIGRERLMADPGIGFGKTLQHNLELLSQLTLFHGLGVPVLVGASRKRFIGALSGEEDPKRREPGSFAAAIAATAQGVQALRVHDVAGTRQALAVWQASSAGGNY